MTTEVALQELNRTIGMLLAAVDGLRRDFAASDAKSDQWRANVHRRLDQAVDQIGEIEARIERLTGRIGSVETRITDDIMPTVVEVRAWKQRGIGMLILAGFAGASILGLAYYLWHEIVARIAR